MIPLPLAIARAYRKMLVFRGRASRAELNWFLLLELLAWTAFAFIPDRMRPLSLWSLPILNALLLAPKPALMVRRLHDCNLSGWWCLLYVPLIFLPRLLTFLALLLLMTLPGTGARYANAYGDPKRDPDLETPPALRMLTLMFLYAFFPVILFLLPNIL